MKSILIRIFNFIYYSLRNISTYSMMIGAKKENKQLLHFFRKYKISKSSKILDVGCGYGRNLLLLGNEGYNVTGIDINVEIVKSNKEKGFNCFSVEEFKELSDKYDVVLMSHVIEHLSPNDLFFFMDYYLDFLKEDGKLIIFTPLFTKQFYMDFDHIKPYSYLGISMVFSGKNQVQYYSRNKLKFKTIDYVRVPYNNRTISYRTQSLNTIYKGLLNLLLLILYYLSFSFFGINANWMGIYSKSNM